MAYSILTKEVLLFQIILPEREKHQPEPDRLGQGGGQHWWPELRSQLQDLQGEFYFWTDYLLIIGTGSMQFGAPLTTKSRCVLPIFTFCHYNKMHESFLQKASTNCTAASFNLAEKTVSSFLCA